MILSNEYFTVLVDELERTKRLCDQANQAEEILYYYSYSFGIVNRILNFECSPELIFIHQTLQAAHQTFSTRLGTPHSLESESFMGTPRGMLNKLVELLGDLITSIKDKDDNRLKNVLMATTNLSYATTGNGFYLYKIGKLTL